MRNSHAWYGYGTTGTHMKSYISPNSFFFIFPLLKQRYSYHQKTLRPGSMFYYHNPLTFPSGAPRLPSLELPFSSTQPCEHHDDEQDDEDHDCYRDDDSWTTYRWTVPIRPGNDLPLWSTRRSVPSKKTAEKQNHLLSATVGGEDDLDGHDDHEH